MTTEVHWGQETYIFLSGVRQIKVSGVRQIKLSGARQIYLACASCIWRAPDVFWRTPDVSGARQINYLAPTR